MTTVLYLFKELKPVRPVISATVVLVATELPTSAKVLSETVNSALVVKFA